MQIQIQPQQGTINYPHYFCRATASMHIVQIITMIQTNMRTLRHTIHHLTRSRLYVGIMPSSLHHWPVTQIQPLHISTNLFISPQTKGCTRPIQLCCALHHNVFQMHCNAQHTSPNSTQTKRNSTQHITQQHRTTQNITTQHHKHTTRTTTQNNPTHK